jgi:2-methylcitrate dehydratase
VNDSLEGSWIGQIASTMLDAFRGPVPEAVLERAAVQVFDSFACAAGAIDAHPVRGVRNAIRGSGPADATLLFTGQHASIPDAVLANGTAVRYLDLNDAFIGSGPGGHPSDNIPVALAVAERENSSGRDTLAAIALGYDLYARFRGLIYAETTSATEWDGTSVSGIVSALIAGLLLGLDSTRLTNALAIGAAKGYGLKQVRRGSISSMKACGNALVAREGTMAALLAAEGITGPGQVIEGRSGLLKAFGIEATEDLRAELIAQPAWAIRGISNKLYPAIATSQAAIDASVRITRTEGFRVEDIASIVVRLPDSKATREHLEIKQRQWPDSRESADHSISFLVAVALEDGQMTHEQFEHERWLRPSTLALMERLHVEPDAGLAARAGSCYPAIVEVMTIAGKVIRAEVDPTPGSPELPLGLAEVAEKFARFHRTEMDGDRIDEIAVEVGVLPSAPDLERLLALVR